MPALPEVFPHVPPYPTLCCPAERIFYAGSKIGVPASDVVLPFFYPLFQRQSVLIVPAFSDLVFQFLQTGLGESGAAITVDAESQKFSMPGTACSTFVWIDSQLQVLGYPFRQAGQYSLAASFAFDEYHHIVGIAAEA